VIFSAEDHVLIKVQRQKKEMVIKDLSQKLLTSQGQCQAYRSCSEKLNGRHHRTKALETETVIFED